MHEYVNRGKNDIEDTEIKESSFEEDFNSTFAKLKSMQDEIILDKITYLESVLNELELFFNVIIEKHKN